MLKERTEEVRDPRLAELQFLADLDERGFVQLNFSSNSDRSQGYGLDPQRFKEMVFHVMIEGYVNGPAEFTRALVYADSVAVHLQQMLLNDLGLILNQNNLTLRLNHKGRLRLWTLRDELHAARRLTSLGIIYAKEHWATDWEVTSTFLPADRVLSLFVCDMDNFKQVNEKLGHDGGDRILRTYFQVVKDVAGRYGDAYCFGGDEVVAHVTTQTLEQAREFAERIREQVQLACKENKNLKGVKPRPTLSAGGATFSQRTEAGKAFHFVDQLLLQAKRRGKNVVVWETYAHQ